MSSGAGEGGAHGGGGNNFLMRWRGWQDRVAADPSFPYKVFIEQARPLTKQMLYFAAGPILKLTLSASVLPCVESCAGLYAVCTDLCF